MTHILGVSSPRSGHHLFEAILRGLAGQKYKYCESYSGTDCCKNIPCNATNSRNYIINGVFFQKSHDFYFTDPLFIEGTFRLIQIRDPIPRAFSNYSLYLRNSKLPDNEKNFRHLLEFEAAYFIRFYRKWLLLRTTPAFILRYEKLIDDPIGAMQEFLNFCKLDFDPIALQESVSKVTGMLVDTTTRYVPRDVHSHNHANSPYCAQYEDIVFKYCEGYQGKRYFASSIETSEDEMTPFEHAVLAYFYVNQIGKERETVRHAQAAQASHQDDIELNRLLKSAQLKLENIEPTVV